MKILILVAGMTAVTYLPRLIPLLSLSERQLPPLVRRFLLFIPYTALGALIIPGAFQAIPGYPIAGLVGILASLVSAWVNRSLILAVAAGVLGTYLTILLRLGC